MDVLSSTFAQYAGLAAIAGLSLLLSWLAATLVRAARLREGARLLVLACEQGASLAWDTYTRERKARAADGRLTDEEAAEARRLAWDAARAFGLETARRWLGLGEGQARAALEATYQRGRRVGELSLAAIPLLGGIGTSPAPLLGEAGLSGAAALPTSGAASLPTSGRGSTPPRLAPPAPGR